MKKTKTKTEKKIIDNYELLLKLNGEEIKTSGSTLEEAFEQLKPVKFNTKGILTAKHGNNEATRLLLVNQMKRLFRGIGGTTQKIQIACTLKFIKLMLGEKTNE